MHKLPTSIPNAGSWGHIAQMNTMFNHYVRPTCEGFLHKFIKFRTHKFADSLHFGMDGYVEPFCLYDNESYCASVRFPPISDFRFLADNLFRLVFCLFWPEFLAFRWPKAMTCGGLLANLWPWIL